MFRDIINFLPPRAINILCVLSLSLIAYTAASISSRYCSHLFSEERRKSADATLSILGGGFSFLLSFVLYNSWNYSLSSRNYVVQEANTLAVMTYEVKSLPTKEQQQFRQAIKAYVVTVRTKEWQSMRHIGQESPEAAKTLDDLVDLTQAFNKTSDAKNRNVVLFNSEFPAQVYQLVQLRRQRLNELNGIIPAPLYDCLITGTIILMVLLGFFRGKDDIFRVFSIIALAMLVGFNLGMIINFHYVFSGKLAISNVPFYQGTLAQL